MPHMSFVDNILNSGAHFKVDNRDKYRINFINVILLAAVPLFAVYGIVNAIKGLYFVALIDSAILVALGGTFFYLRHTQNASKAAYTILIFPLPIYYTMLFNGGGLYQSAFFWYFFYPLFALLLKGNRKGLFWLAPFITSIFGYYFYMSAYAIQQPYDKALLLVLGFALILETLVVMYYERVRKIFDAIIIQKNRELSYLKRQLETKVAIESRKNNLLNSELVEIQKDIIFTMGTIGESRSHETGNHVKRVSAYAKLLARKLKLPEDVIDMIAQAAPMHDIGKVAIPDSILNKPDRLTPQEWEIMRQHSKLGYQMLQGSNRSLLKLAATVAHEHHERYDGLGYPNGLKKEEIHIAARITALADVFDALGSDRVYKKAWDNATIFDYLKSERGYQFDPKLVDIFFENVEPILTIQESLKDAA